ncbi:MAG TPA: hypothetical protein VMU81_01855 [Acetobacteraceae bacterium]|jgi:hypothetical protein|nr:hypothetical protein [Acetobacteraceae bacterium]
MAAMALDTHAFVKTLTAAGMPEAQAEAVTSIVRQSHEKWLETLVAKDDLKFGLGEAEGRVKLALADSANRLQLALADSENRLQLALAETKADIMKWMIGTVGGAVIINAMTIIGAMLALTKMGGH